MLTGQIFCHYKIGPPEVLTLKVTEKVLLIFLTLPLSRSSATIEQILYCLCMSLGADLYSCMAGVALAVYLPS